MRQLTRKLINNSFVYYSYHQQLGPLKLFAFQSYLSNLRRDRGPPSRPERLPKFSRELEVSDMNHRQLSKEFFSSLLSVIERVGLKDELLAPLEMVDRIRR